MKNKASTLKTLGLIGGMSWESTVPYYQLINRAVQAQLGGLHSAKLIVYSVDFADIEQLQARGQWQAAGDLLANVARMPSSWAAPKSPCCSIRKTAPCRCLTPPPCTPKGRHSGRCQSQNHSCLPFYIKG